MKKALLLHLLWIFGFLQPLNSLLGIDGNPDNYFVNGSMLLEKNRDQIYPSNLQYLDDRTPIKLDYTADVKKYIDHFLVRNQNQVSVFSGKSDFYFPLFEEILAKHNLPLELKNLAVIESGLNPFAVSKSGAVGLWQFLFHTSKMFDLKIDSYIDERRDPVLSTEAACKFLSYLYTIFNDWQLAITAYNCGPGAIEKAIEDANGSTDYWVIRNYLYDEAKNYYPKFVAACYAMAFNESHGIQKKPFNFSAEDIQTVEIKQSLWFKQIAKVINVSESDLRLLNPAYKQDYVPVYNEFATLLLPKHAVKDFHKNELAIYTTKFQAKDYNDLKAERGNTEGKVKTTYNVKAGEYFHQIAMDHGCTIYDIMVWNNLKTKNLRANQQLVIYINKNELTAKLTRLKPLDGQEKLLVDNQQ